MDEIRDELIKNIETAHSMYFNENVKLTEQKYITEVMFKHWVDLVNNYRTRYDLLFKFLTESNFSKDRKAKNELKKILKEDFFTDVHYFNIEDVVYLSDNLGIRVNVDISGDKYFIGIPFHGNLDTTSINWIYQGKYFFGHRTPTSNDILNMCYEEEKMKDFITNYFTTYIAV